MQIYNNIVEAKKAGKKKFAVLLDPDKLKIRDIDKIITLAINAHVDYFFIGGSLIVNNMLDELLTLVRKQCDIPLVLFPGNSFQLSYKADALLFLSLISGRNAELLIGKHVITAPYLKVSPLEVISTGYMLIDGGIPTTVSYMSNTIPIPQNKKDVAVCTALAGEMLGLKLMYMDAGSGAQIPISSELIREVSDSIEVPLIIGGGIKTPEKARENVENGADVIVIGNAIEKDPMLITDMSIAIHSYQKTQA